MPAIVIEPQGTIKLCRTHLEPDNRHQLDFANINAQANYFDGIAVKTYTNYTYVRKDQTIVVAEPIDNIRDCNYLFYVNTGYSNKRYYAFITGMDYLSANSTQIHIKTDCFQTYQFSLAYYKSFVERSHVSVANDTVGANTVPEGLETGEYVINGVPTAISPSATVQDQSGVKTIHTEMIICFQATQFIQDVSYFKGGAYYNRQYSGLKIFGVETKAQADNIISGYDKAGRSESIKAIFMAPKEFFQGCTIREPTFDTQFETNVTVPILIPAEDQYATTLLQSVNITRNSTLNGYTPRNQKLYTYPYNYIFISNNAGSDVVYHYEDFETNVCNFYMGGTLGQGCSVKLTPVNYKRYTASGGMENYAYGITGAKYPVCAWASDYYTNWVTQNGVNIATSTVNTIMHGMTVGLASGNIGTFTASAVSSTLGATTSALAKYHQASIMPDQAHGNANCSDVSFAWRRYFTAFQMSIRSEFARIIDSFFDTFGYKVNVVEVPNFKTRPNWNYIKTIDANIEGNIPADDLLEIKKIFNNGVTIWHNPNTMLDYSQNNR